MANKNHALDDQIISAAMSEFLANGYEKASLRKIAASAHVTVGAIYTRYSTKDCLFCSLVQPLIECIEQAFQSIKTEYYSQTAPAGGEDMASSIQHESDIILHLLFDNYDRAVLLLCRSAGSSLEHFLDLIVERKIESTMAFFQMAGNLHPDPGVLKLLISTQFHTYFQIINEGFQLEDARRMMHSVMVYHTGGWLALLNTLQRKEDQEV